ncbi:DNA-binding response regulator [Sulfuriferula plumbiphila]|uniref:DNA-binding response regulator n=1 Tax=Sulfuriferula plumbiphila TaxID=171865 RepID=A0A512L340_9PROT|nr:response regulator transcription factor [Sulfuriferula plumbiphila]BBP02595.1 DNA-binding response regulator [Sulfuriferula plumbiphila]GEP28889.1 DNA-binding response regulator [Sulfuriferula plumbiphila]
MTADCPSLLLVDDDATFREVLTRALTRRGYKVSSAANVAAALLLAEQNPPEYAVVDLKMPGATGLQLVARLKQLDEHTRIVMLTGYASIATAIEAIKLGATHYLAKPAEVDEIIMALQRGGGDTNVELPPRPPSVERMEWEHIQRVLSENDNNISATARALNMHRRTLQRKLAKRPVRQ